ncbi:hypothetical protein IM816_13055 [Luteibacter flocculans]|uniref:PH domain-containing protein n=1 Tax=Luteibacter flocculans TaxID=2780091 RepID=A0ABY4T0R9_9GAMM|nr:hypothetical protein [Luteibacter flocculans]URL57547.1 hypothetical protein IM816_13055 [Luteibacter flocculans]
MSVPLRPSAFSVISSLCGVSLMAAAGIVGFYKSVYQPSSIGMAAAAALCLYALWTAVTCLESASIALDEEGIEQRRLTWNNLTFTKRKLLWSDVELVYQTGVVIAFTGRKFNARLDLTDFRDAGAVIGLVRRRVSVSVADV